MTVMERAAAVVELLPRPLDPVRSIKLKIGILLLASGGAGLAYLCYEYRWQPPVGDLAGHAWRSCCSPRRCSRTG